MNNFRIGALALTSLLTLSACGKTEDSTAPDLAVAGNDLLDYVPSDTPYLMANLEPVPEDVLESYLSMAQPVLEILQEQLTDVRSEMDSAPGEDEATRVADALLQELDGKLNRQGLESMGFDLRAHSAIYGRGAFPVIRLGLSDSAALRATVLRVMENAGVTAPEQSFQGVSYWRVSDGQGGEFPAGLYISILEDHLAMGLWPLAQESERLAAFLGLEKPADSDARSRLAELNRSQGYTAYGSGIVDTHRMIDAVVTAAALVHGDVDGQSRQQLSEVCVAEIHQIADQAPRMTLGVKELTPKAVAVQYRVETPTTLAEQLLGLVSEIPAADLFSSKALEFALGLRFGPVRDFLQQKMTAIVNDPYQCEHLAELNTNAASALERLSQPMPPFLNNFRGIRVSMSEFNPSTMSDPQSVKGKMALHVEQPQMLIGMAQMLLPDFAELALKPGDPPVLLPESMLPAPGVTAYAVMSSDAIGLSVGDGEQEGLSGFLEQDNGPEGMFLSVSYDMAAYLEYSEMLTEQVNAAAAADQDYTGEPHADEIQQAAADAFRAIADRNSSTATFREDGLVIDNRVTFK